MKQIDRLVLDAVIEAQPYAYGVTIVNVMNRSVTDNWLTRRFPVLRAIFKEFGPNHIYPALDRLEKAGILKSEWSEERFPERGGRRRRYYFPTDK